MHTSEGRTVFFAVFVGAGSEQEIVSYSLDPNRALNLLADLSRVHETLDKPVGLIATADEPDSWLFEASIADPDYDPEFLD